VDSLVEFGSLVFVLREGDGLFELFGFGVLAFWLFLLLGF
jgi:hypothetical protein